MQQTKVLQVIKDLAYFSEKPTDVTFERVMSQVAMERGITLSALEALQERHLITMNGSIILLTEKGEHTITDL
jgi:CTP-dependent riboflavin kinase